MRCGPFPRSHSPARHEDMLLIDAATRRLFDDMMDHVPVAPLARDALWARMNEPSRHYHHAGHLAILWSRHCDHIAETGWQSAAATRLIACTIAYHDAIYDSRRSDNEARSADLWLEVSAQGPLDDSQRQWVASTIHATADHLGADATRSPAVTGGEAWAVPARLWVLDLDLTPIGEVPDVFAANTIQLRDEVPHLDFETWDAGRLNFLRHIQAVPQIYRSPAIADRFERAARVNLARELGEGWSDRS